MAKFSGIPARDKRTNITYDSVWLQKFYPLVISVSSPLKLFLGNRQIIELNVELPEGFAIWKAMTRPRNNEGLKGTLTRKI